MRIRPFADGVGVLGSTLCALHCLVAPVLLVAGTTVPASFVNDETFHRALLWAILPAAILAFGLGCWQHKDGRVLVAGVVGLVGLTASAVAPHEWVGELGERALTLASTGLLIAAHIRNFRLCRAGDCAHDPSA